MAEILSYDDALEYMKQLDEGNETHAEPPQADLFRPDDIGDEFPPDQFNEINMEDMAGMMENFQEYLKKVVNELRSIIEKNPELLDEVTIECEYLGDNGNICQIFVSASFRDFMYNHVLVTPKRDWENDREKLIKFMKAMVVREYYRQGE